MPQPDPNCPTCEGDGHYGEHLHICHCLQKPARDFTTLVARLREADLGSVVYEGCQAVISACGDYRYLLNRFWDYERPTMTFVMFNPSTADHRNDDPTIRACTRLAKQGGYGGLRVLNLFAYRTPSPEKLWNAKDPIGLLNDSFLLQLAKTPESDPVVAAWGAIKSRGRDRVVQDILERCELQTRTFCFGHTENRSPKHPLYLPTAAKLEAYKW
jgi:hypothetical protein